MKHVENQPFTGLPLAHGWSKVIFNQQQNLICSLAVQGQNAKNYGQEFEAEITKTKINSAADVHNLVLDLLAASRDYQLTLQLASVWVDPKNQLIVPAAVNGQIFLKRSQKIGLILDSNEELKIIQGNLKPQDSFIISTKAASDVVTQLKEIEINHELTEQLQNKIDELEDSSLIAISLVKTNFKVNSQPKLMKAEEKNSDSRDKEKNEQPKAVEKKPDKEIKIKLSSKNLFKSIWKILSKISKKLTLIPKKINKLLTKIRTNTKGILKPKQENELYLGTKKSKKFIRVIVIILASTLLLFGLWFWRQQSVAAKTELVKQELSPALELQDSARKIINDDVLLARDKTSQAIELITAKQKQYSNDRTALRTINPHLKEAKEFYEEISGLIELTQLEIYLDLREISDNFIVTEADLQGETLVLLDQGQKQILTLNTQTKQVESFNINSEVEIRDFTMATEEIIYLADGINQISLSSEQPEAQQIKESGDSDSEASFIDFFEDYLYVFNPDKRNIYRYIVRDDELSEPIGWLTNKQDLEFDLVSSIAIDGQIWLSDKNGTINLYEKGEPVEFELQGLEEAFGSSIKIFTKPGYQFLYALEPEKERLVTLSKTGEFISQISSQSLASVTTFVVDESQQLALVFSGSLIYQVNL